MFNDMLIVSTAISSFNNAALYNPFFMVVGLLSLPLFVMVYIYGKDFVSKMGWHEKDMDNYISFWTALNLLLWMMLFGGNYDVVRDGVSLLPIVNSFILFGLTVITTQKCLKLGCLKKLHTKKAKLLLFFVFLLMIVFSSVWTWWGILLQTGAVLSGAIIGRYLRKNIPLIPWMVFMLLLTIVAVLMQPEYFRFGQLGNLTIVHLLAIVFAGYTAITALVTRYTNPRGRVHQSAYIKLKWLFRIASLLALVLFCMTESVPVFIGLIGALGLLEMLSVYHSKEISRDISKMALGMFMMIFGIIIICPIITALGIVYSVCDVEHVKFKDFSQLL